MNKKFFGLVLQCLSIFLTVEFSHNAQALLSNTVKTWNVNTNFDNPSNWEGGRVPCSNDKAVFQAPSPVAVLMPELQSVAEMILPMNGQIIFPSNAVLNITGGKVPDSCKGEDVLFRSVEDYWFNPDNWNISSDLAFPRSSSRRNNAVPHVFQVPCREDSIRFPEKTSFKILGLDSLVVISSLNINNIEYSQDDLELLLLTPIGKLLFPDAIALRVEQSTCVDPAGCQCGNIHMPSYGAICLFKSPFPKPQCLDPIEVTGHCSQMCAAKITAIIDTNFHMEEFLQLHQNLHSKDVFNGVESFTARISPDAVQTVFVDGTSGNAIANKMAQLMYSIYVADISSARKYGIRSIDIQKAEKWIEDAHKKDDGNTAGLSAGSTATIIIVLAILLGLTAFYLYRKQRIEGFSFARFDLRSDKIELELGTTPHDELEPDDSSNIVPQNEAEDRGIDNPVYGTPVAPEEPSGVEECPEVRNFVENPMFTIFENQPKEDK